MSPLLLFSFWVALTSIIILAVAYVRLRRSLAWRLSVVAVISLAVIAEIAFALGAAGASWERVLLLPPLGVAVCLGAIFLLHRVAVRPLKPLVAGLEKIVTSHDLTDLVTVSDRDDEIHGVQQGLHTMTRNLRDIIAKMKGGITTLAASASQIASTVQQTVSTATEQAAVVSEVSATMDEIKQTSMAAADGAQRVLSASERAVETGQDGLRSVNDAVAAVSAITERVRDVTDKIGELNEKMQQIGDIVESVNEIAEQSNLLAVNATIEAARAGEHGRGFAVVASEVRNLAEQSKSATRQIQTILNEIRRSTEGVVVATEESQTRVQAGTEAVEAMRSLVNGLVVVLEQTADEARLISGAASQQAAGIGQIAAAMEQVAAAGAHGSTSAKQLETAVQSISDIGLRLQETSAEYSV